MPKRVYGNMSEVEHPAGDHLHAQGLQKVLIHMIDITKLSGADKLPSFVKIISAGIDDPGIIGAGSDREDTRIGLPFGFERPIKVPGLRALQGNNDLLV